MTGDIPGTADDPQAADWGGLPWAGWHGFDEAHHSNLIPATPGIYRFRARDEPGLLYIGESGARRGMRGRLAALARGRKRHPASFYLNCGRSASPSGRTAVTTLLHTSAGARTSGVMSRSRGPWKNTRRRLSGGPWRHG